MENINHLEVVGREQALQSGEGEIALVLVIHGVELDVIEQVLQIRKLENGYAGGLQQSSQTLGEVIEVRHMGQNVVADDHVRQTSFGRKLAGKRGVEESSQAGNAFLGLGNTGDVLGWLDPEHGDAG